MKPFWIFAAALAVSGGTAAAQTTAPAEAPPADAAAEATAAEATAAAPAASESAANENAVPAAAAADDCAVREYAMAVRWQQNSGEVEALQRQAYTLARLRLDEALAGAGDEKLAIVTDLDETAIDNSDLLARDIAACHDFSGWDTWKDWERNGNPTLIPGAGEFFDYADSKGVAIYYISDRYDENKQATIATLKELGLPQVDDEHVLLLGPPKGERRDIVSADHKIIMLLGDTLHDFETEFEGSDAAPQKARVAEQADHFGVDWIVLPNPTYGDFKRSELRQWDAPIVTE